MEITEIERRFTYHAPDDETRELHEAIRAGMLSFAVNMERVLATATSRGSGPSREESLFFTALEEASFWAHAHIARNR